MTYWLGPMALRDLQETIAGERHGDLTRAHNPLATTEESASEKLRNALQILTASLEAYRPTRGDDGRLGLWRACRDARDLIEVALAKSDASYTPSFPLCEGFDHPAPGEKVKCERRARWQSVSGNTFCGWHKPYHAAGRISEEG